MERKVEKIWERGSKKEWRGTDERKEKNQKSISSHATCQFADGPNWIHLKNKIKQV